MTRLLQPQTRQRSTLPELRSAEMKKWTSFITKWIRRKRTGLARCGEMIVNTRPGQVVYITPHTGRKGEPMLIYEIEKKEGEEE